jgi:adenylate cyclase
MISEATCKMLGDRFVVRSLDRVRVVNVNTPIRLYELIDEKSLASEFTLKYTEFWEKVMALFESKKYAEALEGFKKLSEKNPKDKVAKYYISLIEKFFINGTYPQEKDDFGVAYNPEDGVFKLLQK